MTDFNRSDDEQVEELKKWWKENGRAVVFGVVLGLGGVFGWQGWVAYSESQAEQASALYETAMQALADKDYAVVTEAGQQIIENYPRTPYADLSALVLARAAVDQAYLDDAEKHLRWAKEQANQDNVRNIAALRLVRVLLEKQEYSEAMQILGQVYPDSYLATVEELKGDIFFAQGKLAEARAAYKKALEAPMATGDQASLQMKLDDISEVASTEATS